MRGSRSNKTFCSAEWRILFQLQPCFLCRNSEMGVESKHLSRVSELVFLHIDPVALPLGRRPAMAFRLGQAMRRRPQQKSRDVLAP